MNADKTTDVWSITHKEDIGAGQSVGDVTFYAYLCRVADWRLDWESTDDSSYEGKSVELALSDEAVDSVYRAEESNNYALINATVEYRKKGCLPGSVTKACISSLVATQTWGEQKLGKIIRFGGVV